jgi:hypothetical protein
VNYGNGAVGTLDGAEEGKRDCVVAAEGDEAGECVPGEGGAGL